MYNIGQESGGKQCTQNMGWEEGGILQECVSVESAPAVGSPTETGDLLVLNGELVVVGDLLSESNVALGVDHNLLLRAKVDDLGVAVWLQRRKREYAQIKQHKFHLNKRALPLTIHNTH